MSSDLKAILARREKLLARAAQQREDLGLYYNSCERSLRIVDSGWKLFRTIKQHPIAVSLIAGLVGRVVTRRMGFLSNISRWSGRLMTAWQVFSKVRAAMTRPR